MLKNLVYFGSAQFTADILESLIEAKIVNVVAVVTTPDKPVGRKQIVTPSSLALTAQKYNLPVYKPERLDEANLAHLKLLKPDLFLVVAYGQYFTESWLKAPALKTLNIHFSLLPKYRGSLCVSEPLKNGDLETGVTLMEMGQKLDAGPIIAQQKVFIDINDNVQTLTAKLTQATIPLLSTIYDLSSTISTPQDESLATFTPSFKTRTKKNAFIDFEVISQAQNGIGALQTNNFIRSQNPDPGAWTIINDKEIKLLQTTVKDNKLILESVQVAGKNPISWHQFLSGAKIPQNLS